MGMLGRFILILAGAALVLALMIGSMALLGIGVGFGAIFGIWAVRTGFGTAAGGSIASTRLTGRVAEARRRQRWRQKEEAADD
ncbi:MULTISPECIES: hypothetical protein [Maricaulis]|jgi:membrane protein implicated in regulation of membrane protease activity|uniref:Uncharacterized protein n=1 Tax=Maricaulis maris (strain MCS10) TaxID=394221 RepID=Q0ANZ0_MARMM|nr:MULTISPECIES: hypothetical protein [Maricaulis]ABI65997.1 hypothetical protein Mmar10_1705 [Maricaulis maris MCS10]